MACKILFRIVLTFFRGFYARKNEQQIVHETAELNPEVSYLAEFYAFSIR